LVDGIEAVIPGVVIDASFDFFRALSRALRLRSRRVRPCCDHGLSALASMAGGRKALRGGRRCEAGEKELEAGERVL
jgi:hypothetical protein